MGHISLCASCKWTSGVKQLSMIDNVQSTVRGARNVAERQDGSVAVAAALIITALVLGAGVAVDYGTAVSKQKNLQTIADSAAIAAAREMTLANVDNTQIEAVARQMVDLKADSASALLNVSVQIDDAAATVRVSLSEPWKPFFMDLVSSTVTPINADATAQIASTGKVCVLGLDETQNRTIQLKKNAILTANGCGVYSNSTGGESIRVADNGQITAALICSAGGAGGVPGAYSPYATTDCPPIPDPLADRTPPAVGLCDHTDFVATSNTTVSPGVYCGGLEVDGVTVNFDPGIYIIKDGDLLVASTGQIIGDNVGFYFTGTGGVILGPNTTISLTAPKDGDMAGLLFFEDRNRTTQAAFRISSNDARLLLGTIYLPVSQLLSTPTHRLPTSPPIPPLLPASSISMQGPISC